MITTSVFRVLLAEPGTDTTAEVFKRRNPRDSQRRPAVEAGLGRAQWHRLRPYAPRPVASLIARLELEDKESPAKVT